MDKSEQRRLAGFVEVDGVRLHYLERGAGPVVVLLHGNAATAQDFAAAGLVDRRARHCRVIAFDRPGFGCSARPRACFWTVDHQARLLLQAMAALDAASAIVLGHSWGTLVAMAMAAHDPRAVRGLVLVSGYYYPALRLDAPLQAPPAIPLLGDLLRRLPAWFSRRLTQVPAVALMKSGYAGLVLPVVLLAGKGDTLADPQAHSVRLHGELLQSELRLVEGGHMVQHFAQEELADAVRTIMEHRSGLRFPPPLRSDMAPA
ncbi:MAG: alpha/beta hydrolase [Pseudoduganella sp.]|nr:alpha/beta hydrolase [Pseudoduganella sp.]